MDSYLDLLQLIHSFEDHLGNPADQKNRINFQESLRFDEQEVLAWPQIQMIQRWGFMEHLIPKSLDGRFISLDRAYFLVKAMSRRDLTIGIALGLPFLGALPIWIAGNESQKKDLAASLRRGEITACALTEEEHGSDIMANEVFAQPWELGWKLSGRKWCINFATQGHRVTLLCRTHEQGGPLGFSLFSLDKSKIESGFTPIPKLPTHGVKGLDISGFTLDKVLLPQEALIGNEKRGLEIIYKTLQVSRTLCASFSVGAADTALRFALAFSKKRQLYGHSAYEIPVVRQRLGEQFILLLIADCTALSVARAASVNPEKLSFWSAIIKFLVPKISERVVNECGVILGARSYLRTTEWAMFEKIRRDIPVVGLFDGSSEVNLSVIAGSLLPQVKMRGSVLASHLQKLEFIFNLNSVSPEFPVSGLGLFTQTEDDIVAGLSALKSKKIESLVQAVCTELKRLDAQVLSLHQEKQFDPRSLTAFRLAEHYCWIFAASCCIHFWYHNEELLRKESLGLNWLHFTIQLILNQLNPNRPLANHLFDSMAELLVQFHSEHKMFSVVPIKIPQ